MNEQGQVDRVKFTGPEKVIWASFLLLVFSLGFMQPYFNALNSRVVITDAFFLLTIGIWLVLLLFRKLEFRWSSAFWVFGFYLLAMLLSTIFSTDPVRSGIKFLSIAYLVGLAVLTMNLVRSKRHVKHVFVTWIIATGCAIAVSLITLAIFYVDRDNFLLRHTLSHYGTLPPGNYPRIQSTFLNPNMLCNYLALSFAVLLAALKLEWIDLKVFVPLLIVFSIACFFTLSPGIGSILLVAGIWYWLTKTEKGKTRVARIGLFAGISAALMFFFATLFTPIKAKTSPFFIVIPVLEKRLDPSSRLIAWRNSLQTFAEHPITGKGVGTNIARVVYEKPSGEFESLTDSHQMWLNLLGQAGVPGIVAICWLGVFFVRKTLPMTLSSELQTLQTTILVGLIASFLYQGLFGSFEDARHLWVWFGLGAAITHKEFLS